jgi:hypothetical protein
MTRFCSAKSINANHDYAPHYPQPQNTIKMATVSAPCQLTSVSASADQSPRDADANCGRLNAAQGAMS